MHLTVELLMPVERRVRVSVCMSAAGENDRDRFKVSDSGGKQSESPFLFLLRVDQDDQWIPRHGSRTVLPDLVQENAARIYEEKPKQADLFWPKNQTATMDRDLREKREEKKKNKKFFAIIRKRKQAQTQLYQRGLATYFMEEIELNANEDKSGCDAMVDSK